VRGINRKTGGLEDQKTGKKSFFSQSSNLPVFQSSSINALKSERDCSIVGLMSLAVFWWLPVLCGD
jgi:hypothetical protein